MSSVVDEWLKAVEEVRLAETYSLLLTNWGKIARKENDGRKQRIALARCRNARRRLYELSDERVATFAREMPGEGLSDSGETLQDGTRIFCQKGGYYCYVVTGFHTKTFGKEFFDKPCMIFPHELKDPRARFRLEAVCPSSRVHDADYHPRSRLKPVQVSWKSIEFSIPSRFLWFAEVGKKSAKLVLFYSEEFRFLPLEIKKVIYRLLCS